MFAQMKYMVLLQMAGKMKGGGGGNEIHIGTSQQKSKVPKMLYQVLAYKKFLILFSDEFAVTIINDRKLIRKIKK